MDLYCSSFDFLGKNSKTDFQTIITTFDNNSNTLDSILQRNNKDQPNYSGMHFYDYGSTIQSPIKFSVTLIQGKYYNGQLVPSNKTFTQYEVKQIVSWLSGSPCNSLFNIYGENNQLLYIVNGKVENIYIKKQDDRIIGIKFDFVCDSPYAKSSRKIICQDKQVSPSSILTFNEMNLTENLYNYNYLTVEYLNTTPSGEKGNLNINIQDEERNLDAGNLEITSVINLASQEKIYISDKLYISSDKNKKFNNDFNYIFPRLSPGENTITITGNGKISLYYQYYILLSACNEFR